jgi:hypothetical protein
MNSSKKIVSCLALAAGLTSIAFIAGAQTIPEMKYKLNDTGSHYLKWTFANQVWLRYNESNPGTTVFSEPAAQTFDIGLRRTRIQFFGQVSDHVFFYTQFGQNNFNYLSQNAGNRKLQVFFHDALGEYKVWKDNDMLKLGAGLTITNGLSRFSQPSISTIMTMDVPVFAQATVDQTDEFSRKLSMYARGQLKKLDYRLVLSDPFPITTSGSSPVLNADATFAQRGHHQQYQTLLIYNLFDKESNTTPYMTGTYLGAKKVLNVEFGIIRQKSAMWSRSAADADTVYSPMTLWSAAIFYDAPINAEKGTALNAYVGYFDYDFGPNYLRYNGSMNPANGTTAVGMPAGSHGNSFPMMGTGKIVYMQFGYLFRKGLLNEAGTLMPYVALTSSDFNKLKDRLQVFDVGINWLINAHQSKFTLDYQNRTVFANNGGALEKSGTKGQVVLQYQIAF